MSAYENVGDNRYALVFTKTVDVVLANEVLPFLYSNQYVNFNEDTKAVTLAKKLTEGKTELEAVQEVYEYVIKNIVYDEKKAETVKSGYLPSVDETLKTKKGICFDYTALMTAMLRSSGPVLISDIQRIFIMHGSVPILKKQAFFMKHYKGQEFSRIT